MATFEGQVEFKGKPLTLEGNLVERGMRAPNFRLKRGLQEEIEFDDFRGDKVFLLTSAMSVDTSTCGNQLIEYDGRAAELSNAGVEVWYISRDLPFALERFAKENGIENVNFLSDYQYREFGDRFGLTIGDFDLLARANFVVDRNGQVVYKEIVPEASEEPDYNAAINAAQNAARTE